MKVCKDTSSVKIVCADCDALPYALVVCVVEGLSLERRKRACEPPASHMMNRGNGNRSCTSSYKRLILYGLAQLGDTNPRILLWLLEDFFEIFIAFLILVTSLPPFCNCFSVIYKDLEKGV